VVPGSPEPSGGLWLSRIGVRAARPFAVLKEIRAELSGNILRHFVQTERIFNADLRKRLAPGSDRSWGSIFLF
jgi:hypothetical protein